jgi:hypothetical protein
VLVAAGVQVTKKEYECTILRGIPSELATFASHLLSSALIAHGTTSINLDALTSLICEEEDHLKSCCTREYPSQKEKSQPETEIFTATEPREQR